MSNPSDKRQAILEAALDLFTEQSFGSTRVPEIAARAGVAAGTLYRYFDGKEALVNALYQDCISLFGQVLDIDGTLPVEAQVRSFVQHFAAFLKEHRKVFGFLEAHCHNAYLADDSRALGDNFDARLTALFTRWQDTGELVEANINVVIALVFGGLFGFYKGEQHEFAEFAPQDYVEAEDLIWRMIRRL